MHGAVVGVLRTACCYGGGEVRDGPDCNVWTRSSVGRCADRRAADGTAVGDVVAHCGLVFADIYVVRASKCWESFM